MVVVRAIVRVVGFLVSAALYATPVLWVFWANVSLILPQHEFVGYRLYGSLAILWGRPETVYVVQGYPMQIVQHGIVWLLVDVWGHDPVHTSTLDLFTRATLAVCYGLGTLLLAWIWWSRRYVWSDRLLLSAALVTPWWCWPVQPLWLSPDYWPWSGVYAVASAAWSVYLIRGRQRHGWLAVVLCGCWLGLGVSHKLLLGAVGSLPLVVLAGTLWRTVTISAVSSTGVKCYGSTTVSNTVSQRSTRCTPAILLLAPLSAALTVLAVLWAFSLGNIALTWRVLGDLVAILGRSDNGFTASQLGLFSYPFFWAAASAAIFALTVGQAQRRWLVPAAILLTVGLLLAAVQRPSMTTYVDVGLFLAALVPIGSAGVWCPRRRWLTLLPLLLVPPLVWWAGSWRILTLPTAQVWSESARVVQGAYDYAHGQDRPVTVWMPTWLPPHYPYSIEQIALYHGRLALGPDGNDGALLTRLFPQTRIEFRPDTTSREAVWQAARRGEVIVWGETDQQPLLTDQEPAVLRPLRRGERREFTHHSLGTRRIVVAWRD